jgi:hypothetical protein
VRVSTTHAERDVPNVWRLPRDLYHWHVSDKAGELLAGQPASLTIDLRDFKRCEPTVEPHLLDFVTLAERLGTHVALLVHSTSAPGSDELASRYEQLFGGPLAGLVLAELAGEIRDERGRDRKPVVERLVRSQLAERHGLVWHGAQRAAPIACDPWLPAAPVVQESDPKRSRQLVLNELRSLGLRTFEEIVFDIATCVLQAIENIRLHSAKELPPGQLGTFGFFAMRRVLRKDAQRLAEKSAPPLRDYYRRHLGARRHVEITVADNGSGIAATMAGTRDVYDAATDLRDELEQLRSAFARGSSIRSSSQGRGLGLPQMLDAVHGRDGMMIVRSGRIRAHAQRRRGAEVPVLSSVQRLPYPVGTTVVFVFPEPRGSRRG